MSLDARAETLKKLFIKFKKPVIVLSDDSPDLEDFLKLIELNSQLTSPKSLCVNCWCLCNESQTRDHRSFFAHNVITSDKFTGRDNFINVSKENGRCSSNPAGAVVNLALPTSTPPAMTTQSSDSVLSTGSALNMG